MDLCLGLYVAYTETKPKKTHSLRQSAGGAVITENQLIKALGTGVDALSRVGTFDREEFSCGLLRKNSGDHEGSSEERRVAAFLLTKSFLFIGVWQEDSSPFASQGDGQTSRIVLEREEDRAEMATFG